MNKTALRWILLPVAVVSAFVAVIAVMIYVAYLLPSGPDMNDVCRLMWMFFEKWWTIPWMTALLVVVFLISWWVAPKHKLTVALITAGIFAVPVMWVALRLLDRSYNACHFGL